MILPKLYFSLSFFLIASFVLQAEVDFVRDVKPILEHNCVSCHRADNDKGGIRLDTKAEAFKSEDLIILAIQMTVRCTGQPLCLRMTNYSCLQLRMKTKITLNRCGKENPFYMDRRRCKMAG